MSEIIPKFGRAVDDLSYARIMYNNLLAGAGSTDAEAVLIPNTYERWEDASGTMQDTFQPSSSVAVSCVCIGAHNLGSKGSTITVETAPTVAGTWTERAAKTPTDNKPIMFLFDEVTDVEDVRITVTGGTDREIGVIYAGVPLIMQRAVYGGHKPVTLNAETSYQSVMSDTGQFLGRTITKKGSTTSFSWKLLEPDWYRETFHPFVVAAKTKPFFIMWRPDYHPDEVAFGYTTGDLKPTNQGGGIRYLDVSMSMRAHDE